MFKINVVFYGTGLNKILYFPIEPRNGEMITAPKTGNSIVDTNVWIVKNVLHTPSNFDISQNTGYTILCEIWQPK